MEVIQWNDSLPRYGVSSVYDLTQHERGPVRNTLHQSNVNTDANSCLRSCFLICNPSVCCFKGNKSPKGTKICANKIAISHLDSSSIMLDCSQHISYLIPIRRSHKFPYNNPLWWNGAYRVIIIIIIFLVNCCRLS